MTEPTLETLLLRYRQELIPFMQRHGGLALRYETVEDLLQGVHVRALERRDAFAYAGEKPFLEWVHGIARSHLVDRSRYWGARKRSPARLLRLTGADGGGPDTSAAAEPAGRRTGPGTFAQRRELLSLAVKAVSTLSARDRDLVTWHAEGLSIQDMVGRLGLTYEATQRAQLRALERFRKAYRLLTTT